MEYATRQAIRNPQPQARAASEVRSRIAVWGAIATIGAITTKMMFYMKPWVFLKSPGILGMLAIPLVLLVMCMLAIAVVGLIAARVHNRKSRYIARLEAEGAITVLLRDGRLPVVYLRPFGCDDNAGVPSPEEKIKVVADEIGPLVAIGRPGEELPSLGANRFYVEEGEWKNIITLLLNESALVIIRVGVSLGIMWEFQQAVTANIQEKLILHFESSESELNKTFRSAVKKAFALNIPSKAVRGGFVAFDCNWSPRFSENLSDVIRR